MSPENFIINTYGDKFQIGRLKVVILRQYQPFKLYYNVTTEDPLIRLFKIVKAGHKKKPSFPNDLKSHTAALIKLGFAIYALNVFLTAVNESLWIKRSEGAVF